MAHDDRVYNPKSQRGIGTNSPSNKPTCVKCGNKHFGECFVGSGNFFGCVKSGHKVRDYNNVKRQDKGSGQAQANGCF